MDKKTIILSKEDKEKLNTLYKNAQNTPILALSSDDALKGKDFATIAWNEVRYFMDALGLKYTFNPKTIIGIDGETGEVLIG
jgi:hypothetical protein